MVCPYDCGVFVIEFVEMAIKDDYDFSQTLPKLEIQKQKVHKNTAVKTK